LSFRHFSFGHCLSFRHFSFGHCLSFRLFSFGHWHFCSSDYPSPVKVAGKKNAVY
jgi:hypothetical protein